MSEKNQKTPSNVKKAKSLNGGAIDIDVIRRAESTSTLEKLEGFYWFAFHTTLNHLDKIQRFINYYMFSIDYQPSTSINRYDPMRRYLMKEVDNQNSKKQDNKCNVSVISQVNSLTADKKYNMYDPIPFWIAIRDVTDMLATQIIPEKVEYEYTKLNENNNNYNMIFSPIDKIHLIHSIFLKMLNEIKIDDLSILCKNIGMSRMDVNELIACRQHNKYEFTEIPHHLLCETVYLDTENSEDKIKIQTNIDRINEKKFEYSKGNGLPIPTLAIWNNCLARLYFYFLHVNMDDYDVTKTYHEYRTDIVRERAEINLLDVCNINNSDSTDIYEFSLIETQPPLIFTPEKHDGEDADRKSGYGIIHDKNKKKLYFDPSNGSITTYEKNTTMIQEYNMNAMESLGPRSYYYSTLGSRIPDDRNNLLCYLSELVYLPNDVIKNVSDTIFKYDINDTSNKILYIGNFDDDPSYPYAFSPSDDTPVPSYSRVHAWLYVNNAKYDSILELYIVSRGSKTALDWEDIDRTITEGNALYNVRSLSYVVILGEILKKIADMHYLIIEPLMKPTSTLRNGKRIHNRKMQIFSAGHSLGGFLGLYMAYMSISRNIIESFGVIKGLVNSSTTTETNVGSDNVYNVNRYIIPIVFQPFVKTTNIINSFSNLPRGIVHTVVCDLKPDCTKEGISSTLNDAASITFVKTAQHSNNFTICKYKNIYKNKIIEKKLPNWVREPLKRKIKTASASHMLFQMSGLAFKYYSDHIRTKLYIKTNKNPGQQSLECSRYMFLHRDDLSTLDSKGDPTPVENPMPICLSIIKTNIDNFLTNPNTDDNGGSNTGSFTRRYHGGRGKRITRRSHGGIGRRITRRSHGGIGRRITLKL